MTDLKSQQAETATPRRVLKRKPKIEVHKLEIDNDIPMPATFESRSPWIPLLQRMQNGDSVVVPDTTLQKMNYVKRLAKQIRLGVAIRAEGTGVRLWRVDLDDGL